ncbi:AAA family ATPase [Chitinophaga sp. Cy-1792]|uniref:AAA family ATPase n=1 Tax=Chitinophaga sp. Cy-1792 TaxID=2608339 RepID=UPI00141F5A43|nr:AAA family ATPase [Chitinophaga sp. Cy-1792]NIG53881.1 AAA family ATPase [Chitinophaga sp. Cy-1792]
MEAIIFCGIQATGKSTFYQQHFFNSHVRISLDLLSTRNRENLFLDACFNSFKAFVVDNTNTTMAERNKYILLAKENKYRIKCYYFKSELEKSLQRNSLRTGKALIPEKGVLAAYKRLQIPTYEEGFDELYYVSIQDNQFVIKNWEHEI